MSEFVREIDGTQLKELVASGKTVVCDFWAAWCMPCRMLAPTIEKLAEEFAFRAEFVKVNVDDNQEAAIEYGINAIPDVTVFSEGKDKTHSQGYKPEAVLRSFFEENL